MSHKISLSSHTIHQKLSKIYVPANFGCREDRVHAKNHEDFGLLEHYKISYFTILKATLYIIPYHFTTHLTF